MAGFYSNLFANNSGKVYFDIDVLLYDKCVISTLSTLNDGGELLEITVDGVLIQAIKYSNVVVIEASELLKLGETEQNLLVDYEQTPNGRRDKTGAIL
jgi:DNA topoisomerase VI subunit A